MAIQRKKIDKTEKYNHAIVDVTQLIKKSQAVNIFQPCETISQYSRPNISSWQLNSFGQVSEVVVVLTNGLWHVGVAIQ